MTRVVAGGGIIRVGDGGFRLVVGQMVVAGDSTRKVGDGGGQGLSSAATSRRRTASFQTPSGGGDAEGTELPAPTSFIYESYYGQ